MEDSDPWEIHNDEPALFDGLKRKELVEQIAEKVATCTPPRVFGIHGPWGTGKTSFLCQLQLCLTGNCPQRIIETEEEAQNLEKNWRNDRYKKINVIWFEAWRYQYDTTPIVALLQEIRTQLSWTQGIFNQAKKTLDIAFQSALINIENLTKLIGVNPTNIQKSGKKWEKEHFTETLPSHVIRGLLKKSIEDLIGREGNRLVVLIDDLDRCEPEAAFRLLEGIKIYLNLPNCVFVLGMDQRLIQRAIAKNMPQNDIVLFGNEEESKNFLHKQEYARQLLAKEYLEKICQDIRHIGTLPEPTRKDYFQSLFGNPHGFDKIIDVIKNSSFLPPNARKIKAFSNKLKEHLQKLGPEYWSNKNIEEQKKIASAIIILTNLSLFHHEVYERLQDNPRFYNKIFDFAKSGQSDHPVLKNLKGTKIDISDTPDTHILKDIFPSPSDINVLRVQELIKTHGPIVETELNEYLENI
jgi:hypothetical protein